MKQLADWQFYLLLGFTLILTASIVPVFKIVLQEVSLEAITFYHFFIPIFIFLIILIAQKKTHLIKEYSQHIPKFIPLAFIGLFLNRIFYLKSFEFVQATEANILYYTYPLIIAIFGFALLKEEIKKTDIAGLILGFLGALIVITKLKISLEQVNLIGDILAILGGASWAFYLMYSKKLKLDSIALIFYTLLLATIITGAYTLLFSNFTVPSLNAWLLILYLGLAEGLLFFLFIELLTIRNTFKVANSFYIVPFIVAILNFYILGETIYTSYIIGLALLIAGIIIQNKNRQS